MDNRIPMPSKTEREASIQMIVDKSLTSARPSWRSLPLAALVFGVEDCLFLAVLLGVLPLVFMHAENLADLLGAVLFLSSPLLYAAAYGLTMWKEALSGTLDWKRTCRLPLQTLLALRMGLFGGAAVLMCVPVNLLLWRASGGALSLVRMLGISFSSLFLHAALSLAFRRLRWGLAVPVTLWVLLGTVFLWYEPELLLKVPCAVLFLLAGAGLVYCLSQLRLMLNSPNKGGPIYAFC